MKNAHFKLFVPYLAGLAVMAAAAGAIPHILGALPYVQKHWLVGIAVAVTLCLGAVLCHVKAKGSTPLYITGYLLNALGSGCAIGTLYAEMVWIPYAGSLAMALLPAIVLGLSICLGYAGQGKVWRKVWSIGILVLTVFFLIAAILVWVGVDRIVGSMGFFSGVCLLFFQIACLVAADQPEGKWRYLSFSGFWAFAVIAVVVVIILSEGDILDGLDLGDAPTKKKQKRVK